MKVKLVSYTQNADEALKSAIGNCYDSQDVSEKTIEHVIKSGHTSVLEFVDFHFHIEGVSRALLAQLTRHRIASYAVRSQRYCIEDGFGVVVPMSIQNSEENTEIFNEAIDAIRYAYEELIKAGVPAEDARFILPNATETVIDMKINMRSLMNFVGLRTCTRAQWEIRKLASLMVEEVEKVNLKLSKYLVPKCLASGVCTEKKTCGILSRGNLEG